MKKRTGGKADKNSLFNLVGEFLNFLEFELYKDLFFSHWQN